MEANHLGRESELTALGRTWRISRWTRKIWNDWLDWAKTVLPDPVDTAQKRIEKWPAHLQAEVARDALDRANMGLSIGSRPVSALMDSPEGACQLLYLLLKKHQPDVTEDDAMDILMEVGLEAVQKRFDRASGTPPVPAQGNA